MLLRTKTIFLASTTTTFLAIAFSGCAVKPVEEIGDSNSELNACAGVSAGPCAGQPIDEAVQCAVRLGARVLSYYRSPAQQECVRRQNHCTNRCSGNAGCDRPTASCTGSPHTQCRAVDFVNNGAPLTAAQLRSCGLAKTTAPHENHYDYVGGGTTTSSSSSGTSGKPGSTSSSSSSGSSGSSGKPGSTSSSSSSSSSGSTGKPGSDDGSEGEGEGEGDWGDDYGE